jgi:methylmalonyl-CoA/ethylmalonyl-CoA epimerase
MTAIKKINHIAIAVQDLDEAIKFWRDELGLGLDHIEEVSSQKSRVAFFQAGQDEIELVEPTEEGTGLARFIQEKGPGIHHLCFEVDNLEETLTDLKSKGIRLINESPVILPGRKMAFIHPKAANGVLLELYQITE